MISSRGNSLLRTNPSVRELRDVFSRIMEMKWDFAPCFSTQQTDFCVSSVADGHAAPRRFGPVHRALRYSDSVLQRRRDFSRKGKQSGVTPRFVPWIQHEQSGGALPFGRYSVLYLDVLRRANASQRLPSGDAASLSDHNRPGELSPLSLGSLGVSSDVSKEGIAV